MSSYLLSKSIYTIESLRLGYLFLFKTTLYSFCSFSFVIAIIFECLIGASRRGSSLFVIYWLFSIKSLKFVYSCKSSNDISFFAYSFSFIKSLSFEYFENVSTFPFLSFFLFYI